MGRTNMETAVVAVATRCYDWLIDLFDWDSKSELDSEEDDSVVDMLDRSDIGDSVDNEDCNSVDNAKQHDDKAVESRPDTPNSQVTQSPNRPKRQLRGRRLHTRFDSERTEDFIRRSTAAELQNAIIEEGRQLHLLEADIKSFNSAWRLRNASYDPSQGNRRKASCSPEAIYRLGSSCGLALGRCRGLSSRTNLAPSKYSSCVSERRSSSTVSQPGHWMLFRGDNVFSRLTSDTPSKPKMTERRKKRELFWKLSGELQLLIDRKDGSDTKSGYDSTGSSSAKTNAKTRRPKTPSKDARSNDNNATTKKCTLKQVQKEQSEEVTRDGDNKATAKNCPPKDTDICPKESKTKSQNGTTDLTATNCSQKQQNVSPKKSKSDAQNGHANVTAEICPKKQTKNFCLKKSKSDAQNGRANVTAENCPKKQTKKKNKWIGSVNITTTNCPPKQKNFGLKKSKSEAHGGITTPTATNHPSKETKLCRKKSKSDAHDSTTNCPPKQTNLCRKKSKSNNRNCDVNITAKKCLPKKTEMCPKEVDTDDRNCDNKGSKTCLSVQTATEKPNNAETKEESCKQVAPKKKRTRRKNVIRQCDGPVSMKTETLMGLYRKGITKLRLADLFSNDVTDNEVVPWASATGTKNCHTQRAVDMCLDDVSMDRPHELGCQAGVQALARQEGDMWSPGMIKRNNRNRTIR